MYDYVLDVRYLNLMVLNYSNYIFKTMQEINIKLRKLWLKQNIDLCTRVVTSIIFNFKYT